MNYDCDCQIGGGSVSNDYETDFTFWFPAKGLGQTDYKIRARAPPLLRQCSRWRLSEQQSSGPEIDSVSTTQTLYATGSGLAGMELGYINWGDGAAFAGPASLQTYWGAYIQDDIKLTSKLTVNAGLRWDYEPPRTERFNRQI